MVASPNPEESSSATDVASRPGSDPKVETVSLGGGCRRVVSEDTALERPCRPLPDEDPEVIAVSLGVAAFARHPKMPCSSSRSPRPGLDPGVATVSLGVAASPGSEEPGSAAGSSPRPGVDPKVGTVSFGVAASQPIRGPALHCPSTPPRSEELARVPDVAFGPTPIEIGAVSSGGGGLHDRSEDRRSCCLTSPAAPKDVGLGRVARGATPFRRAVPRRRRGGPRDSPASR